MISSVLPAGPFPQPFHYMHDEPLSIGQVVVIPFRSRKLLGVIWETNAFYEGPLKNILHSFSFCLSKETLEFIQWGSIQNFSHLGAFLKLALPLSIKDYEKTKDKAEDHQPIQKNPTLPELSPEQWDALLNIQKSYGTYKTFVIDGVTGSGKTEVYFYVIKDFLQSQKQVLVLLPEIMLTSQWLDRFESRFHIRPWVWHSNISAKKKRHIWWQILQGTPGVVVGARSALFLPFTNLGVIVVDEEHDASYKQESYPLYQARDLAISRGRGNNLPVVLCSATPSLETFARIARGTYQSLPLTQRFAAAQLPTIKLLDLKKIPPRRFLLPESLHALQECLSRKEQALLFLNRRGYAPVVTCAACGHRAMCPKCHLGLIHHQKPYSHVLCHYCGWKNPLNEKSRCPTCNSDEGWKLWGPGIERIFEEILEQTHIPEERILLVSRDTMSSSQKMNTAVQSVLNHQVDILIGTQILAKGHHFPDLSLVIVIDGDCGLSGIDFRAGERTYQLLHQVSGRAGRETKKGTVLLQTHFPEHPLLQAIQRNDREGFYNLELSAREAYKLPPFSCWIQLTLTALSKDKGELCLHQLHLHRHPRPSSISLLGPIQAPLFQKHGVFRWNFLVQGSSIQETCHWVRSLMPLFDELPSTLSMRIDRNPYDWS